MQGAIGVLSVGAGDIKLVFDPTKPEECIRAARIVKDMLRRGYAILVDAGEGKYTRAYDFDEKTHEYIIADFDPLQADAADNQERKAHGKKGAQVEVPGDDDDEASGRTGGASKKDRTGTRRVPAAGTAGVAVARTSGG